MCSNNTSDIIVKTCVEGKPSNRLDGRQESCLKNCVDRFIDTNMLILQVGLLLNHTHMMAFFLYRGLRRRLVNLLAVVGNSR